MFRKGEYVIYGNNGICCIEEIGVPRDTPLGDSGKEYYTDTPLGDSGKEYYTLAPVFSSGKIYAPLDTKVFMRPILTKAEAEELILQIPEIRAEEVIGQDVRALGEKYKGCLDTHRCEDLVRLIKTVTARRKDWRKTAKSLQRLNGNTASWRRSCFTENFLWHWRFLMMRWRIILRKKWRHCKSKMRNNPESSGFGVFCLACAFFPLWV